VEVPTEVVDVNVHPNKSDVRFADNRIIYSSIYTVINSILEGNARALDYVVQMPSDSEQADEQVPIEQSADVGVKNTIKPFELKETP
jgi:DNA mismatch repair ATPase MutL